MILEERITAAVAELVLDIVMTVSPVFLVLLSPFLFGFSFAVMDHWLTHLFTFALCCFVVGLTGTAVLLRRFRCAL